MKKLFAALFACALIALSAQPAFAAVDPASLKGTKLSVYNWGDYMSLGADDSVNIIQAFEDKYGIDVVYDTYSNNETMYAKLKGGGVSYDVIIPSDYMIGRMIQEDMLAKLDFSNIPNYKNIAAEYKNLPFDPDNAYSVPYNVGMVGLIYSKTLVQETPDSWNALWDSRYKGNICMINNPRDAFAIAQALLNQNYNTTTQADWEAAAQKLKDQKPLIKAYVDDQVYNMMEPEPSEAALAPYYAGDYLMMLENNENLGFVYPKEGVNEFVDSVCVMKNSENKAAAELFINFLLEPEIALANAEHICYASPNTTVRDNPEYSYYQNEILYPSAGQKPKTQIFENLPQETLNLMSGLWDDVKAEKADSKDGGLSDRTKLALTGGAVALIVVLYLVYRMVQKKKREG